MCQSSDYHQIKGPAPLIRPGDRVKISGRLVAHWQSGTYHLQARQVDNPAASSSYARRSHDGV